MNLADLQDEVERDTRLARSEKVIYLEGKTDVEYLFALMGKQISREDANKNVVYQDVLVKGCVAKGSGATAVRARVALGTRCWPLAWGDEPDWHAELASYGPYVVLNRVGVRIRTALEQMSLVKYINPDGPLKTASDFAAILVAGKGFLLAYDVEHQFIEELAAHEATVRRSLDEAHAYFKGKWLVDHMAPRISGRNNAKQCTAEWIAHAVSVGGLAEVRDWWERVTGSPP